MNFESATAVERLDDARFTGFIAEGWDISGNANGGYLMAMAGRAMRQFSGCADPVSLSAHFLAPGRVGPTDISLSTVKAGRRFTTMRGSMNANGKPLIELLGCFTNGLPEPGQIERIDAVAPSMPSPDACFAHAENPVAPNFFRKLDIRIHPEDAGWAFNKPSGEARVRGWFRWADQAPVDSLGLLLALDAFPPTIFNANLPVGWAPTVELTAHIRARPAPGWLRAVFTTRFVSGGFLEEDGEIWDESDRMVAQSRQLALVPLPPASSS